MAKAKYGYWLTPEGLTKLEGWARDGLTDEQVAKNVGIRTGTLYAWKKDHPKISEALKKGKEVVDYEVENALLKRALGYTVTELRPGKDGELTEVEKEIPGDVTAQIFWLKNRRPERWREKQVVGIDAKTREGTIKELDELFQCTQKNNGQA